MRKLKLDVDDLAVESFTVSGPHATGGTVEAQGQGGTVPITQAPSDDICANTSTCIGPTYCCGATGPSVPICIGPTYCCNPTANTGCCPPPTGNCPTAGYTCDFTCDRADCIL